MYGALAVVAFAVFVELAVLDAHFVECFARNFLRVGNTEISIYGIGDEAHECRISSYVLAGSIGRCAHEACHFLTTKKAGGPREDHQARYM